MCLGDLDVEVRPEDFRGLAREPAQRIHAGRVIAGKDHRDFLRSRADQCNLRIRVTGGADDDCLLPRDAGGEHGLARRVMRKINHGVALCDARGKVVADIHGCADGEHGIFRRARDEHLAHASARTVDQKSHAHLLEKAEALECCAQLVLA